MEPIDHFLFGLIFSAILYLLFPGIGLIGALIVLVFSVAGDVDHYIYFIAKTKNHNLKKAYRYFLKVSDDKANKEEVESIKKSYLFFFHTFEFIAMVVFMSFIYNPLFYAAIGLLFHLFLDYVDLKKSNNLDMKCFSLMACYSRRKNGN